MPNIGNLHVSSAAFPNEGLIPPRYTCEGEGINPPLEIDGIPEGTQTLAIVAEDPDAPKGVFDHWLAWNIPPERIIEENRVPGISGTNSAGKTGYHPPCPPSGSHRYYFHVFALNSSLAIEPGADKQTLLKAMEPHLLAKGTLMGRYERMKEKAGA